MCDVESWVSRHKEEIVSENRVLRRIFVPKWEKVTREWRRLHETQRHNLHSAPDELLLGFI
jgi:hypothetical protein